MIDQLATKYEESLFVFLLSFFYIGSSDNRNCSNNNNSRLAPSVSREIQYHKPMYIVGSQKEDDSEQV